MPRKVLKSGKSNKQEVSTLNSQTILDREELLKSQYVPIAKKIKSIEQLLNRNCYSRETIKNQTNGSKIIINQEKENIDLHHYTQESQSQQIYLKRIGKMVDSTQGWKTKLQAWNYKRDIIKNKQIYEQTLKEIEKIQKIAKKEQFQQIQDSRKYQKDKKKISKKIVSKEKESPVKDQISKQFKDLKIQIQQLQLKAKNIYGIKTNTHNPRKGIILSQSQSRYGKIYKISNLGIQLKSRLGNTIQIVQADVQNYSIPKYLMDRLKVKPIRSLVDDIILQRKSVMRKLRHCYKSIL